MNPRWVMGLAVLWMLAGAGRAGVSGGDLYRAGDPAVRVRVGGELELPSTRFPCVHCHGPDARGGREGGLDVPAIDGRSLQTATPPYDEAGFLRALRDGIAADGRILHRAMPRYLIGPEAAQALWRWLQGVARASAPGVYADRLVLGLALPDEGPLAVPAREVRGLAHRVAERWNAAGGFWGRRVVLMDEGAATTERPVAARVLRMVPAEAVSPLLPDLLPLTADRTARSVSSLLADDDTLRVLLAQRKDALRSAGMGRVYVAEDAVRIREILTQDPAPGLHILAPLDRVAVQLDALRDTGRWTLELLDVHPLLDPADPVAQRYAADARALGFDPWEAGLARLAYAGLERLEAALIRAGRRVDGDRLAAALRAVPPLETGLMPASAPGSPGNLRLWRIDYPSGAVHRVEAGSGAPGTGAAQPMRRTAGGTPSVK
ncbi:MAG TPA: hypothetical protein ENK62_02120 [Chromatiales bacterium]|nr:hypothetical protein [Chromatiales bacterium]